MAQNIYNPATGQKGYQVPGAALPAGWKWLDTASAPTPPVATTKTTVASKTTTPALGTPEYTEYLKKQAKDLGIGTDTITPPAKAPAPVATPAAAPSGGAGASVTVKSGDTASAIAARLGVTVNDLTGYRSGDPNKIFPGEVLTVKSKTVSTGANAGAGVPNNEAEIARINAEANQHQDSEFSTLTEEHSPTVDVSTSSKLAEKLIDSLDERQDEKPPSLVEQFNTQRQALGVGVLEDELAGLDAEVAKLDADYASTIEDEEGRQVSLSQVRRRQSAEELTYNRAKRDLMAKRQDVANRLDTKLGMVSTIVSLTGQDYQNATNDYNTKFNQALQTTNLIKGIEDEEKSDKETANDNARANLTVMYNLIKEGNVKYEDLDPAAKTNITKMEIQAGLPSGFFRYLQTNVKDSIVASSTRESSGSKYYDIITKDKDGALTTKSIYIGKTDTGSDTTSDSKVVENFNKDVSDTDARIKAGTNGQFMRNLYARYPQIDKADIERKVNETYPEGWDL